MASLLLAKDLLIKNRLKIGPNISELRNNASTYEPKKNIQMVEKMRAS